jgi:hypothetical protein
LRVNGTAKSRKSSDTGAAVVDGAAVVTEVISIAAVVATVGATVVVLVSASMLEGAACPPQVTMRTPASMETRSRIEG